MKSDQIRKKYLDFFEKKQHKIIPSSSLVPQDDPSVLFNTAGMQQLTPYLLGQKHPKGKKLANIQKCLRTNDIEEVGDKSHLTFFEMVGHWSLGDYFKEEEIPLMYEFLTSKDGLNLSKDRLYFTIFEGDKNAPEDKEALEIWKKIVPENRVYSLNAEENFWSAGDSGPCGRDSEYFYDTTEKGLGNLSKEEFLIHCEKLDIIEICNSVFMEYEKKDGKIIKNLKEKNVDFGGGFERWCILKQNVESVYETDLFNYFIKILEENSDKNYLIQNKAYRIICDHMRASVFLISDGVLPSNKDQGYILRKLLRRSLLYLKNINFNLEKMDVLLFSVVDKYKEFYPNLEEKKDLIYSEISKEFQKFEKTLHSGMKKFEEIVDVTKKNNNVCKIDWGVFNTLDCCNEVCGKDAYDLFTVYGLPLEIIKDEAHRRGVGVDEKNFNKLIEIHKESSRISSDVKFKGGLGGDSPKIRAFHTTTHLLLAGLRKILGEHVHQAGSNITEERSRFDFTHDEKVQREVLDEVENYVNSAIENNIKIYSEVMEKEEAKKQGVEGSFWEKYPDKVSVYVMKDDLGNIYSRELCGGPHVENSAEISQFGKFKIKKEESSSAGVRRVKCIFV